jgi:hypothetical protein
MPWRNDNPLFGPLQYQAPARIQASIMLALTDAQLQLVMTAAVGCLWPEKRSLFLERIAARLRLRGANPTDAELEYAVQLALTGLIRDPAA